MPKNLKHSLHILSIIFFLSVFNTIIAQEKSLLLFAKDSIENVFLSKINFQETHKDSISLLREIDIVSGKIKKEGYFLHTIDSVVKKANNTVVYFKLNNRITTVIINSNSKKKEISINKLTDFLNEKTSELEEEGNLFSEVFLKNITSKENVLFADLEVKKSQKRKIEKIIIKGYSKFSKKKINRFLNIKKNNTINNQELRRISKTTNSLGFISEMKPPEILFKKDSTLLYLYLKKKKQNNFDGIMNFASKENGNGILFSGHLNLILNNILDTGEKFNLLWKANGEERQNFAVSSNIPYIFDSPFSVDLNFKLHKQDSSFINNRLKTNVSYNLNNKFSIGLTYESEDSKNTLTLKDDLLLDYKTKFIGFSIQYKEKKQHFFSFSLNPSFGNRNSENKNNYQSKINFDSSLIYNLNKRNAIFIRNETGLLFSENNLTNELFRIGGANSIRGFDEESIFSSKFSYLNLEYRYQTSIDSYLYSITDIGLLENNAKTENIIGFGVGYLFSFKNSQMKLSTVIGKKTNNSLNFNNSKIIFNLVTFF